ncbi:hypothetical protein [Taibaiella soli]|nr:hypothetical protein [Taibaiella soli]
MTTKFLKSIAIASIAFVLFAFELPDHWHAAGSEPKKYDMGIEKGAGPNGKNAATIKSKDRHPNGFGTLMQTSVADKYLGKRVRMSGYMKSEDVVDWAGLWLRVDGVNGTRAMAFDNMAKRPVKGTTDWRKYEIVLNIPLTASSFSYGALLCETGQIWFTDINFEIVDNTVPTTGECEVCSLPEQQPVNLSFEN